MTVFGAALRPISVIVMLTVFCPSAAAQVICIKKYLSASNPPSLGFAPSDAESLVTQVATAIGLIPNGIWIIPCDGVNKVQSIYYDRQDVPKGEYVVYDPTWVREVIGSDRDEAIVIFGHELGHLFGGDFTVNSDLPRIKKETNADHFAGCAAARLDVKWEKIQNVLSRIRGDTDTDYPSRERSLAAARTGFYSCLGAPRPVPPDPRLRFRTRYSLGYQYLGWHVIVGSFPSESAAQAEAAKLNRNYPNLFFEEAQSNPNIWMVTLGSGVGKADADHLLSLAKDIGFTQAYIYCWGVGPSDPNARCKQ